MDLTIRRVRSEDVEQVVQLSLLAWAPVFPSLERVLGKHLYDLVQPEWQPYQRAAVEAVCRDEKSIVLVAEVNGVVSGFIAYELHAETKMGEVQFLAVHPQYQNQGIGLALNTYVLDEMRASGMTVAMVETGGDPSHAPARACYEKAGYTLLPIARYFKAL